MPGHKKIQRQHAHLLASQRGTPCLNTMKFNGNMHHSHVAQHAWTQRNLAATCASSAIPTWHTMPGNKKIQRQHAHLLAYPRGTLCLDRTQENSAATCASSGFPTWHTMPGHYRYR
jgi:hypothetical protein